MSMGGRDECTLCFHSPVSSSPCTAGYLKQLKYEPSKSDLCKEGFDHKVFSADLPQAAKVRKKQIKEETMKELPKNKKTFSASGLVMPTKNMVFRSQDGTENRENHDGTVPYEKAASDTAVSEQTQSGAGASASSVRWWQTPTNSRAPHATPRLRYFSGRDKRPGTCLPLQKSCSRARKTRRCGREEPHGRNGDSAARKLECSRERWTDPEEGEKIGIPDERRTDDSGIGL